MTFQALQEYLDVVKWKDSEKIRADMCGRYARCRYCNRTEDFPCARAHNRLIEVQSSPVPDHIPDWLLPEPPVKEQFGEEVASEDAPDAAPSSEVRETAPENPVNHLQQLIRIISSWKQSNRLLTVPEPFSDSMNVMVCVQMQISRCPFLSNMPALQICWRMSWRTQSVTDIPSA